MSGSMEELLALVRGKRAEIKARSGGYQNAQRLPSGKSRWRILPGWNPANRTLFYHDFGQHYIKDKDGNVQAVYVCEMETYGRPCTICETISNAVLSTKDDSVLKLLKEMKGSKRILVNALRCDGSNADLKKPVLLELPPKAVFEPILGLIDERSTDDIDLLSLATGRDVNITKEGAGIATKYAVTDAAKSSTIDEEVLNNLIDIEAWIETEYKKGVAKGMSIVESTARSFLSLAPHSSMVAIASPVTAASLTPASRIIDADEVPWEDASVAKATAAAAVADSKPGSAPVTKAPATTIMDDEDLNKLLESLDS